MQHFSEEEQEFVSSEGEYVYYDSEENAGVNFEGEGHDLGEE
jgi:hypothetical protein